MTVLRTRLPNRRASETFGRTALDLIAAGGAR
jgi:hypothetical protein